jgi:hypothetical protein
MVPRSKEAREHRTERTFSVREYGADRPTPEVGFQAVASVEEYSDRLLRRYDSIGPETGRSTCCTTSRRLLMGKDKDKKKETKKPKANKKTKVPFGAGSSPKSEKK